MSVSRYKTSSFVSVLFAGVCAIALSACSEMDFDLAHDLQAPTTNGTFMSPPVAPDAKDMHPALQVARARGLKTNVYFNEELQQAVARLQGMEETLGRLQSDLQGTAMAMQRVEMMRQEVDSLNLKLQSIQERLVYAAPQLSDKEAALARGEAAPMAIMGDMARPAPERHHASVPAQISQPVVEHHAKPVQHKAPAYAGKNGVVGVRFGEHGDSVRIVLDINGSAKFTTNLDAAEHLLTVELPDTQWGTANSAQAAKNSLVSSYAAQKSGHGSVVGFALKGDAKLLNAHVLKAGNGKPARLVIDLAK